MSSFEAILLGLVQGVTEFLPISSSGHLIITRTLFGIEASNALAFDAILHMATAAAVILYFHKDLWLLLQTLLRSVSRLPVNQPDLTFLKAVGIGTVPAVLVGLTLETWMETLFRSPVLVAVVLVLGSVLFAFAEWRYINDLRDSKMTVRKGLVIGLFQCLALIPGMSRSGATMVGGMLMGLTRSEAAKFSFIMAVPIILGAGSKKMLDLLTNDVSIEWGTLLLGATVAFLTGLLAVHFMLTFVRRNTLWPFIWYRVLLAAFVLGLVFTAS